MTQRDDNGRFAKAVNTVKERMSKITSVDGHRDAADVEDVGLTVEQAAERLTELDAEDRPGVDRDGPDAGLDLLAEKPPRNAPEPGDPGYSERDAARRLVQLEREAAEDDAEPEAEDDAEELDPEDFVEDEPGAVLPEDVDPDDLLDLDELGDRLVAIKSGDNTTFIPVSEAVRGAMRQVDYSKKTMQLSQERSKVEEQRMALATAHAEAASNYQAVLDSLGDHLPLSAVQKITEERDRKLAEFNSTAAEQMASHIEKEGQLLRDTLGWDSEDKVKAGKQRLVEAAAEYGFEPEALSMITDHRALVLLNDAYKYREMARKGEAARGKARKGSSRTLKPGTSSSRRRATSAEKDAATLRQKARRTGDVRDAAAALLAMEQAKAKRGGGK